METENRDLVEAFGFSRTAVRRWTLQALGKDPQVDQTSGVARKFSITDGFCVFLFGYLITKERLNQKEAQAHIKALRPTLQDLALIPNSLGQVVDFLKDIDMEFIPGAFYRIERVMTTSVMEEIKKKYGVITRKLRKDVEEILIPAQSSTHKSFKISLKDLILEYIGGLSKVMGAKRA